MAKKFFKGKEAETTEEEVITNVVADAAVVDAKVPETMTVEDKIVEEPKPAKKSAPKTSGFSAGDKATVKSSSFKAIIGQAAEVIEQRGDNFVVQVGANKYVLPAESLEKA